MKTKKLKLETLQVKGFITDLSASKGNTLNVKGGGWYGSCGSGGSGGGGGRTRRCDDWGTEEGTRFCTDPEFCRTEDCPTDRPGCN